VLRWSLPECVTLDIKGMMTFQEKQESKAYLAVLNYLRAARLESSEKKKAWDEFQQALDGIVIDDSFKSAIQFWVLENLEHHHPEAIRVRELHEMESILISSAAHCKFLEATHHGMISLPQGERLLDELLENNETQFDGCDETQMENGLLRIWKRNASKYKDVKVN